MPVTCTAAQGIQRRLEFDYYGSPFARREYFRPSAPGAGPDAYLVEQSPGSVVRPHFHVVDQFQVVVTGSGTLGRKEATAVTAHYADAYTGYGPIVASDDGLFYFTLRPGYDGGAQYLPEEREKQLRVAGGRRHRLSRQVRLQDEASLRSATSNRQDPLFEPDDDGLAASELVLAPGQTVDLPSSAHGAYLLVLYGDVHIGSEQFDTWSVLYYGPSEPIPSLSVDSDGAQLLHLRFPEPRQPLG